MKKALIYALALALALSLAACGQPHAEQPPEPAPSTSAPEPQQAPTAPAENEDTPPPEETGTQDEEQEFEEIGHDELMAVFEQTYEVSKEIDNSDSEETILNELEMMRITVICMEKSLPSDYETLYREWRPSVVQQETQTTGTTQQPPQQQDDPPDAGGYYENPNIIINEEDRGTTEFPPNIKWADPDELYTGIADPYDGYGEVIIGYGEDVGTGSNGALKHKYTPGGIKIIEED